MFQTTSCPDVADLQRVLLGQVADRDAEQMEQHLLTCDRCVQALHTLKPDDALIEAFRLQAFAPPSAEKDRIAAIIQRVGDLASPAGDTTVSPAPDAIDPESIDDLYKFLAPAQSPAEIGRLGGYSVLKVLGSGGMGVVFLAEDVQLRRRVALKVMKPSRTSASAQHRFLREAQALAAVKHDHIVTVYQVGQEGPVPFVAMELLAGESLDVRLKRERKLPLTEVLRIGREAACGLAAAHASGLIHRDVKPGNLCLEGPQERVKLLDFGLARGVGDNAHLTQSGTIVGTPSYMAPEQARGDEVDARCDLFSLGCVLYRIAVGELPFKGSDTMSVLMSLAVDHPRPPIKLRPDLPGSLNELILRLLAKDREQRPPSAQALVAEIETIEREMLEELARAKELPTPAAAYIPTPKPERRRRWPWVVAASVLLAVLGGGGIVFGPTILRIVTNKGVLVIESEVGLEVIVRGEDARIIDPQKNREIELRAGDHEIEVRELPDGVRCFTKRFTLTRGGTEVVNARLELAKVEVRPPQEAPAVQGGQPLNAWALTTRPAAITGVQSWTLETRGNRAAVRRAAYNPDGTVLAVAGDDSCVRLFETKTGRFLRILVTHDWAGDGLTWSSDGKVLGSRSPEIWP